MAKRKESMRSDQQRRTRKDLLRAAARLLTKGRKPDMDEVAREALVSRATAYRYFPSIDALLVEAPLDEAMPEPGDVFARDSSTDPAQRLDKAEARMHERIYQNEAQLRIMLAASLERKARAPAADDTPVRQNRRIGLIEAALAPSRSHFTDEDYRTLCAALALVFGTESMVVCNDVLGLNKKTARKIKSWAIRALVRAALEQSAARH